MEAVAKFSRGETRVPARKIFSLDPIDRRRALKQYLYRVPGRPTIIFLYLYFFRLGLLDGHPGFYFCRMRSMYEFFIDVKVEEMQHRQGGRSTLSGLGPPNNQP